MTDRSAQWNCTVYLWRGSASKSVRRRFDKFCDSSYSGLLWGRKLAPWSQTRTRPREWSLLSAVLLLKTHYMDWQKFSAASKAQGSIRVKVAKEQPYRPVTKHAVKVLVWTGISKCEAMKICVFNQIMNAQYMLAFLRTSLCHSLLKRFQTFMQENEPKHTSWLARGYLKEHGINWWHTPGSSADINPIECVWAELKWYIARRVKPLNKKDLVNGIVSFWSWRMTKAKCVKYIDHMPKVVAKKGCITGEQLSYFSRNLQLIIKYCTSNFKYCI